MDETMGDLAAVTARIETLYPRLSPRLRQAARYVLDRPDDVALNSMRRVAARAGVHPATMVRLAQALAFSGYAALREPFRQHLRHDRGYAERARGLVSREAAGDTLLRDIVALETANLGQTFDDLDDARFTAVITALSAARRLFVVGLRKCYPLAFYFHYACDMFRDNAVLAGSPGGLLADRLRGIGADDALLVVGFSRYTRATVHAAEHAAARGARVIAITDSRLSPLAAAADHVLVVAKESPSFFGSLVGALALVQAIIAGLVAHAGHDALGRLAESEAHLDAFDTYWESAPIAPEDA